MATDLTTDAPPQQRKLEDVRLPAYLRWPMLAGLVAVFLFGGKQPMWRDPFDIDQAIWLSYLPIPLLVAAGLWWSKRLSKGALLLNTVEIVLFKFALTYCIAMVAWLGFVKKPAEAPPSQHPVAETPDEEAPAPTPWPAERRAEITGRVIGPDGTPVADTFVFVSAGLEDLVFERPSAPQMIELDDDGFATPLIVARRWQPLQGRSANSTLHSLFIEGADSSSRGIPLLPSGEPATVHLQGLAGVVPVRCSVHRKRAHLAVLHHAFHAHSAPDGSFQLTGVPALPITLSAWTPHGQQDTQLELEPKQTSNVVVTIRP